MASSTAKMSSSAAPSPPPTIPISSGLPSVQQPTGGAPANAPINTPAFRLFVSRLTDSVRRSLANQRPWHELADRSAFSRPESLSDAMSRVRKNASYFRINYIAIFAAVLAFTLVSNPFSLLVLLGLLAAWCFLYLFRPSDPPLVLFGRQFTDKETLGGLVGLSIIAIFLTSVGSLLISAILVSGAIVCAHGAYRVPEDLFLNDQDPALLPSVGFLSFLTGGSQSVTAPPPAPGSAIRV